MPRLRLKLNRFNGGISRNLRGTDFPGAGTYSEGLDLSVNHLKGNVFHSLLSETNAINSLPADMTMEALNYWLISTGTAKVYKSVAGADWALITEPGGTGALIDHYEDYIYYAFATYIGRYGALSGSPSADNTWQAGNFISKVQIGNKIYFLDATNKRVSSWDNTTFIASALNFPANWGAIKIGGLGNKLVVAVNDGGVGKLLFWIIGESSWDWELKFPGKIITFDNFGRGLIVVIEPGIIYFTDGTDIVPIRPFESGYLGKPIYAIANLRKHAVANFKEKFWFGIEPNASSLYNRGIYSLSLEGKIRELKGKIQCEYEFSSDDDIGSIVAGTGKLLFSTYDNSETNVNTYLVGHVTSYGNYEYHTPILDFGTLKRKTVRRIEIHSKKLPASVSYEVHYEADNSGSWTSLGAVTTDNITYKRFDVHIQCRVIRLKIVGTSVSTATPEIFEVDLEAEIQSL